VLSGPDFGYLFLICNPLKIKLLLKRPAWCGHRGNISDGFRTHARPDGNTKFR
jgi:hypothetical protein